MLEYSLYNILLLVSMTLMLFFGISLIVGKVSNKQRFKSYLRSRKIMGAALLTLTVNYSVHLFCNIRFTDTDAAIFMNLLTYHLEAWLFSCALMILLQEDYLTRRRFVAHLVYWLTFSAVGGIALSLIPQGSVRTSAVFMMAGWFLIYAFILARRLFYAFRKAQQAMNDFHSDNIAVYIRWMKVFTYWAIVFGVGVGLLTFLPNNWIIGWIAMAIPFYIYLYISYTNYMLFYEQIEQALHVESKSPESAPGHAMQAGDRIPTYYLSIKQNLAVWTSNKGFSRKGFTIEDLAIELGTNRTYLFDYIKKNYHTSFREWVNMLRIDYAKELLISHPNMTVSEIANAAGYSSTNHFTKIFTDGELCPPAKWRKNMGNSD